MGFEAERFRTRPGRLARREGLALLLAAMHPIGDSVAAGTRFRT